MIEFSAQPVEFGSDFLDFQHYRAGYPQIAGAVLARNGLIPDGFGAEGALHQTNRYFLLRLSSSSARLAFDKSSRTASRFRTKSFRSSISETGTAMSREQLAQTSAAEAFSCAQNGHVIDMDQGATLRIKLVLPMRPSESLTSTLTMWSPAGSWRSGISMPVACTNDLMRGVKSTVGVLR
jgi:hypothetical protein